MYNSNFPLTNTLVSHAVGKSFNFLSFRYFCGWNRKNGNRLNWHTAKTLSSSKTLLTTRLKCFLKKFVKTPAKVWNFWSCRFYCFALPYLNHALLFPWVSRYRLIQRSCESFPKKNLISVSQEMLFFKSILFNPIRNWKEIDSSLSFMKQVALISEFGRYFESNGPPRLINNF